MKKLNGRPPLGLRFLFRILVSCDIGHQYTLPQESFIFLTTGIKTIKSIRPLASDP